MRDGNESLRIVVGDRDVNTGGTLEGRYHQIVAAIEVLILIYINDVTIIILS